MVTEQTTNISLAEKLKVTDFEVDGELAWKDNLQYDKE